MALNCKDSPWPRPACTWQRVPLYVGHCSSTQASPQMQASLSHLTFKWLLIFALEAISVSGSLVPSRRTVVFSFLKNVVAVASQS